MTEPFFIDTADVEYIKKLWDTLSSKVPSKKVVGITTNPNAMAKVQANSIAKFSETVKVLAKLLNQIRGDNHGIVYVQAPSTEMKFHEKVSFFETAVEASQGESRIGLKITPFYEDMENLVFYNSRGALANVTGLADCSTALACTGPYTSYVSVIPGRMEEAGVDAKTQIRFLMERNQSNTEVIAGSMRTMEGLKWVVEYGCVPTVGSRVFDILLQKDLNGEMNNLKSFLTWKKERFTESPMRYSPTISETQTNLSVSFFKQMDEMGLSLYEDWKSLK